ncbi:hypothetical protein [Emticicia sp. C21]|uniref:hypothetical protein n=1 Tax=Emticicia sp. C21 TaxID=2302915 RepID=UPI000E343C16|nr:hypothetical protein [Emticicia sp. C21]RFS13344.1 hypothetical protein D0T08_27005 [Emticicia sp. C21]
METLNNHKLLVDADCPMCRMYGKGFEKAGWVDRGTYSHYQSFAVSADISIDMNKARNEIALVDTEHKVVRYGIDALKYIITNRFPSLGSVLAWKPVDFFLRKLYKFISFNRKVIAPSEIKEGVKACTPDLNVKYRLLYIAFVAILSSIVLYQYTQPINEAMDWQNHLGREFMICAGQILWQIVFLNRLLKEKLLDYLGNMMTVSMIGTLLLLPMLLIKDLWAVYYLGYFIAVVSFMLWEHVRRSKILKIGYWPTISWMVYRVVALVIIVLLN